jgi:type IV secretory pathway VirB10-like protein
MNFYTEPPAFAITEQGEIQIHVKLSPARFIGIIFVLILHAIVLFYLLYAAQQRTGKVKEAKSPVVLIMAQKAQVKKGEQPTKVAELKKIQNKPIVPRLPNPSAISVPQEPRPVEVAQEKPLEEVKVVPDMMEMLKAARERRQAQVESNGAAQEQGKRGLSAQEIAEANVKRSLAQASGQQGTNGVFQILHKSTRVGSFAFNGWKTRTNSWRQVIEVDAGLGGDIDLAMVRKMIELIRTHYKGDFSWESQRLGRVIRLSARIEDSEELEQFLLKEFPDFNLSRR